jgi:hypothetical protein
MMTLSSKQEKALRVSSVACQVIFALVQKNLVRLLGLLAPFWCTDRLLGLLALFSCTELSFKAAKILVRQDQTIRIKIWHSRTRNICEAVKDGDFTRFFI